MDDHPKPNWPRPLDVAMELWPPWDVPEQAQNDLYFLLKAHLEYMATGGRGMDHAALRRLAEFYGRLEGNGWVVGYDSDGVGYRNRTPWDGKLIVRLNGEVDDSARLLWSFPPRYPELPEDGEAATC